MKSTALFVVCLYKSGQVQAVMYWLDGEEGVNCFLPSRLVDYIEMDSFIGPPLFETPIGLIR